MSIRHAVAAFATLIGLCASLPPARAQDAPPSQAPTGKSNPLRSKQDGLPVATKTETLSENQTAALRDGRMKEARALAAKEQWTDAIVAARAALELERLHHLDLQTAAAAEILQQICIWQQLEGDQTGALLTLRQLLPLCEKTWGAKHWLTVAVGIGLDECQRNVQRTPEELQQLTESARLLMRAQRLCNRKQFEQAIELMNKALAIRDQIIGQDDKLTSEILQFLGTTQADHGTPQKAIESLERCAAMRLRLYGPEHPHTIATLRSLASSLGQQGEFDRQHDLLKQILAGCRSVFGSGNLQTAQASLDLATFYTVQGKYSEAEDALAPALAELRARQGDKDLLIPHIKVCLGRIYDKQGDLSRAERLFREALDHYMTAFGEQHVDTATALIELGCVYQQINAWEKAKTCFERALNVFRAIKGEGDSATLGAMLTLAVAQMHTGQTDEAERQASLALELARTNLGPDHQTTESLHMILAGVHIVQKRYAEAEKVSRDLLARNSARSPSAHFDNAAVREMIAYAVAGQGKYAEALDLNRQVFKVYEQTLPPGHPAWQHPLLTSTYCCLALKRYDEAKRLAEQALAIARYRVEEVSVAQSEAQQTAMATQLRAVLDMYLSLPEEVVSDSEAYQQVLLWKGAVQARQIRNRRAAASNVASLAAELQEVSGRLAAWSLKAPDADQRDQWKTELDALKCRKEALEVQIATARRDAHGEQRPPDVAPEALGSSLPAGTALVDVFRNAQIKFVESDGRLNREWQARYIAFVVHSKRPVERVDLGDGPAIDQLVSRWMKTGRYAVDGSRDKSPAQLREAIWDPVRKHLDGCETVLYSPDSMLAWVALGALPGDHAGTFLIEDFAIAQVGVPQMLPEVLGGKPPAHATDPSLLLVADIDYDADPGRSTATPGALRKEQLQGGELVTFAPLKAAGPEAIALHDLHAQRFGQQHVMWLKRGEATEAAFRREAPQHACVLVVTHGFYAPPGVLSALSLQDRPADIFGEQGQMEYCAALSGLALAGANAPATADGDDGILTASEVATLDLQKVDLAILSGCETGMGMATSGEGTMGLQRAFHVAGARTTISSLWSVPDKKTSLLMQRFYGNLWEKKMPKLAALREAQLWMMRTGGKEPAEPSADAADATPPAPPPRQAPYYWAAFVLNGDWR